MDLYILSQLFYLHHLHFLIFPESCYNVVYIIYVKLQLKSQGNHDISLNCSCWRRLLRVPWTERRSNQSILKEISPEYSLDGLTILWPSDVKNWLMCKDPDAGKDWRHAEKGTTEDEIVGWHHRLNGHEFEWTPGVGDGQGGLACCSPWGRKESDTTERLNWKKSWILKIFICLNTKIYFSLLS